MTDQEKQAALTLAAQHALGAAQVPVTAPNVAKVVSFLDVDDAGVVRVFAGARTESNHARYIVSPAPWQPQTMYDVVESAKGMDPPCSFARLVENLRLTGDLP